MNGLRRMLSAACAAAALALAHSAAQAQETYTLRFNHVLGPSEPFHQGFLKWAERVKERTNGGLTVEVFHSAQLGVEEDIIEQIRQGANIGQNTDSARLGNYVPGIAVVNGPYFVESYEEAFKLADSPTMQGWQQELADQHGLRSCASTGCRASATSSPTSRSARRRIWTACASARPLHQSGRNPSAHWVLCLRR